MASGAYQKGIDDVFKGTIQFGTTALKIMLVNAGYTFDPDHTVVDPGVNNSTSPKFNEVVATNYTGGFGGAGRKTATCSTSVQNANNRTVVIITDITWTALGGATNDTVAAAILIKETTDDTLSRLIAYLDFANTPTNGSDFTLDFDGTNGNLQFSV